MTPTLNAEEAARISQAIEDAETKTSGELFVVVARQADDYRLVPVLWAALAAIIIAWPLHLFTNLGIGLILTIQGLLFVLLAVVLSPLPVRLRVIPPALAEDEVERAAYEQFLSHGIHLTEARTGVLIYAALAEHRVEIVADTGIAAKVEQAEWDAIAAEIVKAAKSRDLASGLVQAVKHSGELLACHFPPSAGDRNELPNKLVQI